MIRPPPRSPLFPYTTLSRSPATAQVSTATSTKPEPQNTSTMLTSPIRVATSHSRVTAPARASAQTDKVRSIRVTIRSEEHTSELQSRQYLVCRLLLEKKQNN